MTVEIRPKRVEFYTQNGKKLAEITPDGHWHNPEITSEEKSAMLPLIWNIRALVDPLRLTLDVIPIVVNVRYNPMLQRFRAVAEQVRGSE